MELIDRILLGECVTNGNVHYEDIMNLSVVEAIPKEKIDKAIDMIETMYAAEESADFFRGLDFALNVLKQQINK